MDSEGGAGVRPVSEGERVFYLSAAPEQGTHNCCSLKNLCHSEPGGRGMNTARNERGACFGISIV